MLGIHDLLLSQPRFWAFVEDSQELLRQFLQQFYRHFLVNVSEPLFLLSRQRDFVVGPLAGQVNADARHGGGRISQAHCRQV